MADTRLMLINELMACYGVESFKTYNGYWSYANTGDTYAATVLMSPKRRFIVSSIGDVLEGCKASAYGRKDY